MFQGKFIARLTEKAEVEILFIAEHFQVCGITDMYMHRFARLMYKWGRIRTENE